VEPGRKLTLVRQLVATVLGIVVIIDALISPADIAQWVAGLVLIGILPLDALIVARKGGDRPSPRQPN
jgi:hypothetical protein